MRTITLMLLLLALLPVRAVESLALYHEETTPRLVGLADSLEATDPERASMLYEMVAGRYESSHNDREARMARHANIRLWHYHYLAMMDNERGVEIVDRIDRIDADRRWGSGYAAMARGVMKKNLYNLTNDTTLLHEAFQQLRLSFWQAAAAGNLWVADRAFANMIITTVLLPGVDVSRDVAMYRSMPHGGYEHKFTLLVCEALQKQGNERIDALEALLPLLPYDDGRSIFFILYAKALEYARAREFGKAKNEMLRFTRLIADTADIPDVHMERYMLLSQFYDSLGDRARANEMYRTYGTMRDSLLNYRQVTSMRSQELTAQMRRMAGEVKDLRWHNRLKLGIIGAVIALLILAAVAGWLFYRKAHRLSQTLETLYQKVGRRRQPPQAPASTESKSDDADAELIQRMDAVLEQNDEIFNSEFTASRFAQLVGESYQRISKILNANSGGFACYVAKRRIAETCRRIDEQPDYRRLTIEAMAASVGIKSRTTFIKYFLMFTGLKPSEYLRQTEKHDTERG